MAVLQQQVLLTLAFQFAFLMFLCMPVSHNHVVDRNGDVVTDDGQVLLENEVLKLLDDLPLLGFEDVLNNFLVELAVFVIEVSHHVELLVLHLKCFLLLFLVQMRKQLVHEDAS